MRMIKSEGNRLAVGGGKANWGCTEHTVEGVVWFVCPQNQGPISCYKMLLSFLMMA